MNAHSRMVDANTVAQTPMAVTCVPVTVGLNWKLINLLVKVKTVAVVRAAWLNMCFWWDFVFSFFFLIGGGGGLFVGFRCLIFPPVLTKLEVGV